MDSNPIHQKLMSVHSTLKTDRSDVGSILSGMH
ncbi:hypothetical protein NXF25_019932 [Crotalus adamanteus]|uniref:Uncharacterized protein n=1 Tax=Crotalus adamanteus TaxID=8729 RepID=A0AAW1B373_CROAD